MESGVPLHEIIESGTLGERRAVIYYMYGTYEDIDISLRRFEIFSKPGAEGATLPAAMAAQILVGGTLTESIFLAGIDVHHFDFPAGLTRQQLADRADLILRTYPDDFNSVEPSVSGVLL